jgi:protein-tyrosine phosphatase
LDTDESRKPGQTLSTAAPARIRPDRRRIGLLVLAAVLVVGGLAFWHYDVAHAFSPKRFGVVEPGKIYRSGRIHPWLVKSVLRKHNIQVIVALLADSSSTPGDVAEKDAAEELHIQLLRFPLPGNGVSAAGRIDGYVGAIEAILTARREGKPVLVHCAAGANRTGGVIAVYRLLVEGQGADEVLAEMRRYGWGSDEADADKLLDYLNSHMRPIAEQLVHDRFLEKVPDPIPLLPEPTAPPPSLGKP